ncbi:hypothetical protein SAMD00019534_059710, partial [Acytostelium subglobosum LB1]|uniref:hypothetical protein n=1 Tax=Acytostelium subglobosum LB1 TaxID=1410327 RepID=UPI0006450A4C
MSSTLLERTRALHEAIERYELMIVAEQSEEPKTMRDNVMLSHRVNHYLEQSVNCANDLAKIYQDEDQTRQNELSSIAGQGLATFSAFYDRLREVKEYHRKFPALEVDRVGTSLYYTPNVTFSGNESHGRFLDLNELFEVYLNLPFVDKTLDYVGYLSLFNKFNYDDHQRFKNKMYRKYLDKLIAYLQSFMERSQPMLDLKSILQDNIREFDEKWSNQEFSRSAVAATNDTSQHDQVDNKKEKPQQEGDSNGNGNDSGNGNGNGDEQHDSATQPATNNTEEKKDDPSSSLYCKACKKLFASQNVYNGHLKGKKHIKLFEIMKQLESEGAGQQEQHKPVYLLEFHIIQLCERLHDQIQETIDSVIKKQSRSIKEIEDDMNAEDEEIADVMVDDEPTKLRIANYPVDWSGKPIPYWVYKFHELGVEYKCEICGNQSYWGRRAFEKHFQESRHSYGMSCIGIPNTIHFHHITKIKDALDLNKKIKEMNVTTTFRSDRDEEYEDEQGEVMNKKTYDMLLKQGLIKK